ncbi:MAG TPA: hypothetical protein VJN96_02665 [Vicinamibacterales bacterium]|nr:hypothetical protein [Vicinamibacterales bacterium]
MSARRRALLLAAALLISAQPALAQVQLQGLGGRTDAADHAPFFAGALGIKISFIEIDLEGGRLHDVLPSSLLEDMYRLERERGLPLQVVARVPATYGAGSVRFLIPGGTIQPFVSAGFGVARLQPQINLVINGINFSDVLRDRIIDRQTSPMVLLGAGIRLDFHAVNIEGGYRYYAILSHVERTTDFSRDRALAMVQAVYGALAFRF